MFEGVLNLNFIKNQKNILNLLTATLHKKLSFPLRISLVNVTKFLMENFIFCAVLTVSENLLLEDSSAILSTGTSLKLRWVKLGFLIICNFKNQRHLLYHVIRKKESKEKNEKRKKKKKTKKGRKKRRKNCLWFFNYLPLLFTFTLSMY